MTLKRTLATALACAYLLGLWIYQLPISPVERVLMAAFRPVQNVTLTDRQYRMYAPGPRSRKRLAFIVLKTSLSPVKLWKGPDGFLAGERWSNFVYHLSKSLRNEWGDYPPEAGREVFRRFAADLCGRESDGLERVRTVSLQTRLIDFSDFRGDIVWHPPEELEGFTCP